MPILTYTGATGLFVRGGKCVKAANARLTTQVTDLPAEAAYIQAVFSAASRDDQIPSLTRDYQRFQDAQTAIRQKAASYFTTVLLDRTEVQVPLGLLSSGMNAAFWQAFLSAMTADSASVLKSTVTLGSVTAAGGNTGTGTVLTTLLLDGYNAPLRGGPALRAYAGLTSQLGVASETMTWTVTNDAGSGATAGKEPLSWAGGINYGAFDWRGEGSGQGPGLAFTADGGILTDGGFEQWTATHTPTQWPILTGTAGTHIKQQAAGANVFRGLTSLNLIGDGALAAISLNQSVASFVNPLRMYNLSFRLKADATIAAGDLTVSLAGTGYSPGGSESVSVAHGSLPTSWTLKNCFILIPAVVPSDLAVKILWGGTTPTNAKNIWLDSFALTPVIYHGGMGAVAAAGAVDPVIGDRWTATMANDDAGKFQAHSRKTWRVQLVSATGGSETIANSLAT